VFHISRAKFLLMSDRELNRVLLNNFSKEWKRKVQDGGLKPEVDTANDYLRFQT